MRYDIPNNLGYVDNDPSSVLAWEANVSEENRIKFVTDLAAISRGKTEASNPEKRYKHLLKEAAPNTIANAKNKVVHASRPLEFLKVKISYYIESYNGEEFVTLYDKFRDNIVMNNIPYDKWLNEIARYSYASREIRTYESGPYKGDRFHATFLITNMRALLNAGVPYEKIPYNKEGLGQYGVEAVRIKAPMFVFNQIMTHTAFSKEARSERVTKLDPNEFWLPTDFLTRVKDHVTNKLGKHVVNTDFKHFIAEWSTDGKPTFETIDGVKYALLHRISPYDAWSIFTELGYNNEITQRFHLELRFKEWVMVGTMKDSSTWEHLFLERNATDVYTNWTQKETSLVVKTIKDAFEDIKNIRLGETNLLTKENIDNLVLQYSGELDISDYVNDINDRKD